MREAGVGDAFLMRYPDLCFGLAFGFFGGGAGYVCGWCIGGFDGVTLFV